jgi:MFS family permease
MAAALPLLGLSRGAVATAIGFCLVSICYAFMLNPTSAELGNAVDRRGLSCYAAVYAVYNIAYAVGQMMASGFASLASSRLGFFHTMLIVGVVLVVFAPLLALKDSPLPEMASPLPVPQKDGRTSS